MPVVKIESGGWLHAHRLPLGTGWSGHCTAPHHENASPSEYELREFCNLGYAALCARLPCEREWDSIRFGAKACSNNEPTANSIEVRYICERAHRPGEHGMLQFQLASGQWTQKHHDARIQRMAECFLESWLEKKKLQKSNAMPAS